MASFGKRLQHAWNAFRNNRDPTEYTGAVYQNIDPVTVAYSSSTRPDRPRLTRGKERSIVTAIYNRIAVDTAAVKIRHVRVDENDRFKEMIKSGLNECLTLDANTDQTGRQLIQDAVMSMFDEGCVAIVPTDTDINPTDTGGYDILSLRTAKITQWYPDAVRVNVYNEKKGQKEEVTLPKKMVAIIENPFYAVMNEPSSTLQRLLRKLILKDQIDETSGANKLNMLVQLPYTIKTETRMAEAEKRRKKIEEQLTDNNKYGVAYIDATEKVTQLNRPLDNNLLDQIRDLTQQLYGQLGLTAEIINGTADEKVMLNYYNRTIEPILAAICDEMKRKFLTKTGRTQGQSIMYFQDHFKLVPVNNIADIADKFTRNEIMTANELRAIIGMLPSQDPKADELRNSNMPQQDDTPPMQPVDPEELQEARDTLIKAGLTEADLKDLRDDEIVELADRYRNNDLEDEESGEAPPGNSGNVNTG